MLKTEDKNVLRNLLRRSFVETEEVRPYNIESTVEYMLLDASDVYWRIGNSPYSARLVHYCIELALYREGYHETAKRFNVICYDERLSAGHKKFFEEEK